ncbi:MAG: glucosamine-6-phosphate isomerase [Spirochaetia bacterium]|nr:glucosamine-6-phosphate isomerase [Spirochaetia bacterium]MCF7941557.1 glucosamine-6-phosphate isomerase [Spirochaetia bacterium]
MRAMYTKTVTALRELTGAEITEVETDVDLYYRMALSLYREIEQNNLLGRPTVCIMPVGPVFQYRRFITLLSFRALDLSEVHLFFMDEYLDDTTAACIDSSSPLSFRGFIARELTGPMPECYGLSGDHIHFPDPDDPESYDAAIEALGGVDLCQAGVGIVGHVAFNEPIPSDSITPEEFLRLPTRTVELTPQTVTINANTALRGAYDEVPHRAVTIGMHAIHGSRKIELYFNRPWQAAVLRKALLLERTTEFPVTLLRGHEALSYCITPVVGAVPEFALQ